jgi:hypothetical protein
MARSAPSESAARKSLLGKPSSRLRDTEKGISLSTPLRTRKRDVYFGLNGDQSFQGEFSAREPFAPQGQQLEVHDVKFRSKDRNGALNQPLPTESEAMPAYQGLRNILLDPSTIYSSEIAQAIQGQEKYAKKAFEALDKDTTLGNGAQFDARKEMIRRFINMDLTEQLKVQIDETKAAIASLTPAQRKAGDGTMLREQLSFLQKRLRREEARPEAESHDRFTSSLLDAFDAKEVQPDLEEFEGRLSGIQDAISKLNEDVLGKDHVTSLRERAAKYQARFEAEKEAEAKKPREVAGPEFTRLEREIAQLGKLVNAEEGLRYPERLRQRIDEIRKQVLQLSNIPGATANPRYDALLDELNGADIAIANVEGDELTRLLSEVGEQDALIDENVRKFGTVRRPGDASPAFDANSFDAAAQGLNRVNNRLQEAYDDSAARFSGQYREAKNRVQASLNRIDAFRQSSVSPQVEARAIVPPRSEARTAVLPRAEIRSESTVPSLEDLDTLLQERSQDAAPAPRPTPKAAPEPILSHVALLEHGKSLELQQVESEMQSSDWTQKVLALETRLQAAATKEEQHALHAELVHAAHLQEVALKREFILHSANPGEMAKAIDHAAALHTRILNDEIGRLAVEKIRALESEGRMLTPDLANEIQDLDERDFARRWVQVRQTSQMVESAVAHLREYHKAELKLLVFREQTIAACQSCIIPREVREELAAATTPAEKRQVVDKILKDPDAMDNPKGFGEWLTWIGVHAARPFGMTFFGRRFGSAELDKSIKDIENAEFSVTGLRIQRSAFAFATPPSMGSATSNPETYTLGTEGATEEHDPAFRTFLESSERAGRLINDLRSFNGTVTESVISRFNSRLRSLEDDMAPYAEAGTVPAGSQSVFELANAKLADARHELGKLQLRQEGIVATPSPSEQITGMQEQLLTREQEADLNTIADNADGLLERVKDILNQDRAMGDSTFSALDRESILLSARLRSYSSYKNEVAYQDAEQTLQELNAALDKYEARALARDRANKNRPAEVLFKNGIASRVKEILNDGPKRAAFAHYLGELSGSKIRVEYVDAVQSTLIKTLAIYLAARGQQKETMRKSFEKIADILDFSEIYRDMGVDSIDTLAMRVAGNMDVSQTAAANDDGRPLATSELPELRLEDILDDEADEEDNTALAA